jgi:signal transduction histidine kinase
VGLLRPLVSWSTYRGWAWLILGGAVLMPYMMAGEVVAVLVGRGDAEAFTLPVQPLTFLAVLPAVALTGLFLPVRPLLTVTSRGLLGADLPTVVDRRDWPTRARTAGWYTIHLAVGGVLSGVTLALLPFVAVIAVLPLLPDPQRAAGDLVAVGWQFWWGPVFGPLAVLALVYLVAGTGRTLRRLAPVFLGPTAADRLAAARQRAAELEVRNRLARELHDSVGHALSVVTLQAAAAGRVADHDPEFVRRALVAVEETARRALSDLDHALGVLRDGDRARPAEPLPDLTHLPALLETCGLQVAADIGIAVDSLPGGASREVYRIVQEALTNALRHGTGDAATLRIRADGDGVSVEVTNPVAGGARPASPRGRGLTGMAERVAALGGVLHTGDDGGRWRVWAHLPVRSS